jgi:hypothetical protein
VGSTFWARDYSGIEAVLVGYFAGSRDYVVAAQRGVHAYFCSHIVGKPADLSWSDETLRAHFKAIKLAHPIMYDTAKRCVHGSNYMMTPHKMRYEYPETFTSTADATRLQGLYFEVFPDIRRWHRELCLRVDGTKRRKGEPAEGADAWSLGVSYAKNPFSYVHRFYNVLDWVKIEDEWASSYGEDAKRLVSFLPQSTAAAIIKRAAKRLWYDFPRVGRTLRLLIHDEVFGETLLGGLGECLRISKLVMESPIEELPLDPSWGMGSHLSIGTEAKAGPSWGAMKTVSDS